MSELNFTEYRPRLAALRMDASPAAEGARFFLVESPVTLFACRFHPGDLIATEPVTDQRESGPVVIECLTPDPGFAIRHHLDPYLLAQGRDGMLQHDFSQSPSHRIAGRITTQAGKPA
ncbi:MAG: hypothetical protein Q4G26_06175 [Paracoccus sp. (in: a-proteobacteria)]|nr:hypothetical protein [Paracoccus sp. (in: a-proteobacteria)]